MSKQSYAGFRSYLTYMRQYKWRFAFVLGCFLIADSLLAVIPVFIGKLVGALTATPMHGHTGVIYVWVLIGLSTGHSITWRISELFYLKFLRPLGFEYENILFRQVIHRPYPYFVDKFTGKVSSYITTTSQELREFIDNLAYNYVAQVVNIVSLAIILTTVNWQTGLIFIVGLIGMFFAGRSSLAKTNKFERVSADVQSTKNGRLIDAIANFVNIKSFQKELTETKVIAQEQTKVIEAARKSFLKSLIFWTIMNGFVRELIWPISIGFNVYLFMHHEISVAQLTTLLSAILLFSTTIWESIWYVSQFTLKLARIEEAHRYLFGDKNVVREYLQDQSPEKSQYAFVTKVELQDLSFAYPDKPNNLVLRSINLSLKKGEKLGIVGRSGSGKTTLTKLLLGYYPAPKNGILLDGQPINTTDLAQLISYVPQDTSLFHRSIADNIAYAADREVSLDEIVTAAKRAHAHEFVAQLDSTYDTLVGERGVKLSAGQRQRIAIARAFLDDKPILILDEATSALDSESEILVQEALEALWEHKTVIAIAHRLSTLRHMDRIIVIDKGRIIEQGTHAQLLKKKGAYAKLWNHQSGGFIEE